MNTTVVFSFDDSPVKVQASGMIFKSDGSTQVREISNYVLPESRLREPFEEGTLLKSMKTPGFGSKPLKNWIKKLESQFGEKPSGLEEAKFWEDHFHNWKDFKGFNPKLLAVADVLETLQMRLTSYYEDKFFWETLKANSVIFGPFQEGLYTTSYQNIIWFMQKNAGDEAYSWALEWCTWALTFAERKYIYELIQKGYDLPSDEDNVDTASKNLRSDVVLYFTKLKASSERNDVAHVFSSAICQKVFSGRTMGNKNRALCDLLNPTIDSEKRKDLQVMLDNLADLSKLPAGLGVLATAIPMQLFFLRKILA